MATSAYPRRRIWSWALYDWANSAFATVVLAGFFPLLFTDYWNSGVDAATASLRLGWANAIISVIIICIAPLLGAVADRAAAKKRFLAAFMLLGVVATAGLWQVDKGDWLSAAALFVLGGVGFLGGNTFYDALLPTVSPRERLHTVSGLGYGLGYLGGGLLYLFCVIAVLMPAAFGFESTVQAAKASFLATAVWWAVFSLPLLLVVREPARRGDGVGVWRAGARQVVDTFRNLQRFRPVGLFLLAYWLYIDAVDTVVLMAVSYGRSLGFGQKDLILALLVVQFVGFPAAILYGRLGERIGPRRGIYLGLLAYVGVCIWAALVSHVWEFYAIAVVIGLVQGGVQSLSRSFYAGLIPADESGEFFGFYNLLGKFAAILGPPLFGLFGTWFGDVRYSTLSLIILFALGAWLLSRVPDRGEGPGVGRQPPDVARPQTVE